jgi:hypothetical protein
LEFLFDKGLAKRHGEKNSGDYDGKNGASFEIYDMLHFYILKDNIKNSVQRMLEL